MIRKTSVFFLLLSLPLMLWNCDSSTDSPSSQSFNLAIDPTPADSDYEVEYSAEKTGDSDYTEIVYNTNSGPVTVENPTLPWSVVININEGTTISLSASGNATNGSATIKAYSVSTSGAATFSFTLTDSFSVEN